MGDWLVPVELEGDNRTSGTRRKASTTTSIVGCLTTQRRIHYTRRLTIYISMHGAIQAKDRGQPWLLCYEYFSQKAVWQLLRTCHICLCDPLCRDMSAWIWCSVSSKLLKKEMVYMVQRVRVSISPRRMAAGGGMTWYLQRCIKKYELFAAWITLWLHQVGYRHTIIWSRVST